MALIKPIVNDIAAFDAVVGTTITFTANGGDQVAGNTIKIVTNPSQVGEEEQVVYEDTILSFELSHTIPPNASSGGYTLTNGNYYKLAIQTIDDIGNTSEWSDYVPFYCYATPTLILNVQSGQTISHSTFEFILTYTQAQNEEVNYAIIGLYC